MNLKFIIIALLLFPILTFAFTDESHYSKTFETTRKFRVFTPSDYNQVNTTKRYPVIYYFHGCGGSYRASGTYSYADFGLAEPEAIGRSFEEDYGKPNNADFENFAYNNDVIIVSIDGKIDGIPGCGVYFPSQVDNWDGNFYNFSAYMRELIDVVDLRYNTKTGPQFRAISGLSMGGQMAIWVAATNPHLFSSASEFCHSPNFYDVGDPAYQTTIDVRQLWRNLRCLPFRHSTNKGDYLKYYTNQLYASYSGAGFENEYYLADFCKHHAARIDLQFGFHMDHFDFPKEKATCFSYINLYPEFEIWRYNLSSSKIGNGWIYLHNVTNNGLGIYTKKQLPFGNSLPAFDISLTTPAIYSPNENYTIAKYSYRKGTISLKRAKSDQWGKLTIGSSGGMGEEFGIIGDHLQPSIFILTDTINENIYINENTKTTLSFEIINLSKSTQYVDFVVTTENTDLLNIISQPSQVIIPALSKKSVVDFTVCEGKYLNNYQNTGFIKISSSINGLVQDRQHIIKIVVKKQNPINHDIGVKVFDGQSEELPIFKYEWGKWETPRSKGVISEGRGNGNGIAEIGEDFSIWIHLSTAYDDTDENTWHPVIPINNMDNPDIIVKKIIRHNFNTGRPLLSAQLQLTRNPTINHPVRIPVQAELLKVDYLENDCHRNTADGFSYMYFDLILFEDGSISIDN